MAADDLEWLGTWYGQQCNGRWEHQAGMSLDPVTREKHGGWRLRIDLRGTDAAGAAPRRLAVCALDGCWLRCTLDAVRFEGEGAEVEELIGVFRRWIEEQAPMLEVVSTA